MNESKIKLINNLLTEVETLKSYGFNDCGVAEEIRKEMAEGEITTDSEGQETVDTLTDSLFTAAKQGHAIDQDLFDTAIEALNNW